MSHTLSARILSLYVLAFIFPVAALADLNQTTTLQANTRLNLDTGATPTSGGDLLWNGLTITPQGSAKAYNLGDFSLIFDDAPKAYYDSFKIVATSATIAGNLLVPGDVFAVFTNGGHTAGVMVTAKSGSVVKTSNAVSADFKAKKRNTMRVELRTQGMSASAGMPQGLYADTQLVLILK